MKLSIVNTKTAPTVLVETDGKKIIFHSKYNPLNESQVWVKKEAKYLKPYEDIIVIGLGAGYHIQELAKNFPAQEITVIEFNNTLFTWFKSSPFYDNISCYKNVILQQFDNLSKDEKTNIFSNISSTNLLVHKSGLDILPRRFDSVKVILNDIQIQKSSIQNQIDNMNENFMKNNSLQDDGIGSMKNLYKGKPMILVSAGPSLDKQLPLLKKIHEEDLFIIGAVGTAVKPLYKNGITPDFFSIIDPKQTTFNQLTDLELPETPLFYLSTAYHDTIMLHKGSRKIMYQEGFPDAEKEALLNDDPLIQTGGSVATAILDLMVFLGGQTIAIVGQDLAYTDGKSHASEAHAKKEMTVTTTSENVMNFDRTGQVHTGKNLNVYRKWFENYALSKPYLQLFNCTEGGAFIENWSHIRLEDYYLKFR